MTMSVNEAHFSVFIIQHSVNAIRLAQKRIYLFCNRFNQRKLKESAGDEFEFS